MKRARTLVGGLLLSMSLSQAAIVVNYVTQLGVGPNGGTLWQYDIDIEENTTARADTDYLIIYDFGPVLSATFLDPGNWLLGAALFSGPTPAGQSPIDNPSILNAQILKTGVNLSGPNSTDINDLTFVLESPYSSLLNGTSNVSTQYFNGSVTEGDTRDLVVPDTGVPEPGTLCMMGAALLAGGFALRRFNS